MRATAVQLSWVAPSRAGESLAGARLDAGWITLVGVDAGLMSRHELRSRMGVVMQDTWLFGGPSGTTPPTAGLMLRRGDHGGGTGDVRAPRDRPLHKIMSRTVAVGSAGSAKSSPTNPRNRPITR